MLQLVIDPLHNRCPLPGEPPMKTSTATCLCESVVMCSQTRHFIITVTFFFYLFFFTRFESKCLDEKILAEQQWTVGRGAWELWRVRRPYAVSLSSHVSCASYKLWPGAAWTFLKSCFMAWKNKSFGVVSGCGALHKYTNMRKHARPPSSVCWQLPLVKQHLLISSL